MQLESVRALKAEMAETVLGRLLVEEQMLRTFAVSARSVRKAAATERSLALGIARGTSQRDYKLAVRIQDRGLDADDRFKRQLYESARGEADIRYIGSVAKRVAPTPAWHRSRQRPLLIGCSAAHQAVTAGTLGGFFQRRTDRRTVILSNNHVLADENRGKRGDAVLQPSPYDGGGRRSAIGTLDNWEPLKTSTSNLIDAATSTIDDGILFDAVTVRGFTALAGLRDTLVDPGEAVLKLGRTTGLTRGTVTAIELDDVAIDYEMGVLRFDRQIEIESSGPGPFSQGGDSGSLILDSDGLACGLLFAGSDHGGSNGQGLTYANSLPLVLDALDLELEIQRFLA